jgi:hypothetical protein
LRPFNAAEITYFVHLESGTGWEKSVSSTALSFCLCFFTLKLSFQPQSKSHYFKGVKKILAIIQHPASTQPPYSTPSTHPVDNARLLATTASFNLEASSIVLFQLDGQVFTLCAIVLGIQTLRTGGCLVGAIQGPLSTLISKADFSLFDNPDICHISHQQHHDVSIIKTQPKG